jgi:bifunctional UDP-N-acetylglucosamine pyrophosphorylase/glucosamine-1-phosphate N-acetyltransferase
VSDRSAVAAVVLAAGQGTRMRSATAKVLHRMCGRTLLGHVLSAVSEAGAERPVVVVGYDRDRIGEDLAATFPAARTVVQQPQGGTGHAARLGLDALGAGPSGPVLVVPGDAPLLTAATLRALIERHAAAAAAATLLTAVLPDPAGYGRVLRDADGAVTGIVEERDADPRTRAIGEVATSVYVFDAARLRAALGRVGRDNAQGEEYLTDAVGLLARDGARLETLQVADHREVQGVNDQVQLAAARRTMRDRLLARWMLEGATVTDPQTTWLGVRVTIAPDATVHQNTQLHGATVIEPGAVVGPNVTLRDTVVRRGAVVRNAECEGAEIGPGAVVGPYTYLRPGTRLGPGAKAGGFVEIKASSIGAGSKVPHLSYVGDATVGERCNIGAATVFVNYDGRDKHATIVGDDVRIGSDTMLVAPVTVGDGSYTAAGSVITEDVPPGALAVARGRQRNVEGWVHRARPGTPAAAAAARAGSSPEPTGPPGPAEGPGGPADGPGGPADGPGGPADGSASGRPAACGQPGSEEGVGR